MTRYLTFQEIVALNRQVVLQDGGFREGAGRLLNANSLWYTVDIVRAELNGKELYPALTDKAAKYALQIITGHVFLDGNKRTGTACALWFLRLNGCELSLSITTDEIVGLAMGIATGTLDIDNTSAWLSARLV